MILARRRRAAPEAQGGADRSQSKGRSKGFSKPHGCRGLAVGSALDCRDGGWTQSGQSGRGTPAQSLPPAHAQKTTAEGLTCRKGSGTHLHPTEIGQPDKHAEHTAAGLDLPDGGDRATRPESKGGLGQSERPPRVSEVLTEQRITALLVRFLTRNGSKRMRFWCGGVGWDGGVRQV
jgi:hypothetical protein